MNSNVKRLSRLRLFLADCIFVGCHVFFCLGLLGRSRLHGLTLLVTASQVGFCVLIGIRDSATALLGGRQLDGERDPRLSLAVSLVLVAVWIAALVGVNVSLTLLDVTLWIRGALLAAVGCGLIVAMRVGRRWLTIRRESHANRVV